jgi:hypothetical protein
MAKQPFKGVDFLGGEVQTDIHADGAWKWLSDKWNDRGPLGR